MGVRSGGIGFSWLSFSTSRAGWRPLGQTTGAAASPRASDVGRALRYAGAPRPPAARPQPQWHFFCHGPRWVNPPESWSCRRGLSSVRGRRWAATWWGRMRSRSTNLTMRSGNALLKCHRP